jgi:AcrR family transcriptional regulator
MMALLRDCVRKILDDHVDLSRSKRRAVLPDIKGNLAKGPSGDRRARRSRAALTAAFTDLALERGYSGFGVNDVAERAAVGRSTLYTHFSGMDDLLAKSLDTHLSTIARCTVKPDMEPELERVISYFWQQRRICSNDAARRCGFGDFQASRQPPRRSACRAAQRPRVAIRLAHIPSR